MENAELFIEGLSQKTSETRLRRYLEGYGRLIDVTIIKDPVTQKSRGYGFVTFEEPRMVHQVLGSRHELDGNTIQVEACLPLQLVDRSDSVLAKKIYVGNLDPRVESLHLRRYFVQFGTISDILISRSSKERRRRYAFVTFDSTYAVRRALKPREHSLAEPMEPVIVNRAYPEAQKVKKVLFSKSGVNQSSFSGTITGNEETSPGGQRNSGSTERFWDESYVYDIHRQKSPSRRQTPWPYARQLTRFFEDGQVGEGAAVNPLRPHLEMTSSGRSSERETSNMVTCGGGENKNYPPKFGREDLDDTGESFINASPRQAFNPHETTPSPGDVDQKLKETEITIKVSKVSVQTQSSRSGGDNNKDGVGRDAQRDQDSSGGKRPDQNNYKSFEELGGVPLQEESCKLEQDPVDLSGSLQEPSKGKEIRKKSRDPQDFRGIAAKTRVLRIRDSDSESQNGTDYDEKEKTKYGSFYDSFGDLNVGSKGGITKLELKDDSTTSSSSGSG